MAFSTWRLAIKINAGKLATIAILRYHNDQTNSMKPKLMTQHKPSQPIGIFDSGIGGLTVAHAIVRHLPNENIIYFGDTAHFPYGDKSTAAGPRKAASEPS